MTPDDIREQKFTRIRRSGYRKDEVDDFLREMTDQYAQLQEQTNDAQSEAARLRVLVHDLQLEAEQLRRQKEAPPAPTAAAEGVTEVEEPQRNAEIEQMWAEMQTLRSQLAVLAASKSVPAAQSAALASEEAAEEQDDVLKEQCAAEMQQAVQWEARRTQALSLRDESFRDNQAIHAWRDVAEYASVQRKQLDQFAVSTLAVAVDQLERGMELVREFDKYLLQMQKTRRSVRALLASMTEAAESFQKEALYFTGAGEEPQEVKKCAEMLEDEGKHSGRTVARKTPAAKKKPAAKKTEENVPQSDVPEDTAEQRTPSSAVPETAEKGAGPG